jgi:3-hydroxyisobutyrate dehydrogenase-like beta-hydroxyacid dehydrogenase
MEVGFIGIGRMGRAMAFNLARAGHAVRAWNRSPMAPIAGVAIAAAPSEVFQAEVVFTMLADDAAVREVVLAPGILQAARPGLVHVVSATISIACAEELAAQHAAAGVAYLSAPVFGRPEVAETAELGIVAAGPAAAVEKVRPLLEVVGRRIWVLGEDPKLANAAKIAGNMMIAMAIEAMAEAAALVQGAGLSPQAFFPLVLQTQFGGSRAYENYSAKILSRDHEPGFRLRLGLKDLGLAAAAADRSGLRLPMLRALRRQMTEAAEAGLGERDWSAIAEYVPTAEPHTFVR